MEHLRRRLFGWIVVTLLGAALPLSGWAHAAHPTDQTLLAPDGGPADICGEGGEQGGGATATETPCLACQLAEAMEAPTREGLGSPRRRADAQAPRSKPGLPRGRVRAAARPRGPPRGA